MLLLILDVPRDLLLDVHDLHHWTDFAIRYVFVHQEDLESLDLAFPTEPCMHPRAARSTLARIGSRKLKPDFVDITTQ